MEADVVVREVCGNIKLQSNTRCFLWTLGIFLKSLPIPNDDKTTEVLLIEQLMTFPHSNRSTNPISYLKADRLLLWLSLALRQNGGHLSAF